MTTTFPDETAPADTIIQGPDYLADDHLVGTAGNDRLYGGKGNDAIDGGDGIDTALMRGSFRGFRVTYDAAIDTYTVVNLGEPHKDTDTMRGVEFLQFNDTRVSLADAAAMPAPQQPDSNGVWQGSDVGYETWGNDGGDDLLQGNGGDDTLYGGKGQDTAILRGTLADYTIAYDPVTWKYVVTDRVAGRDGTDNLAGIELLRFADTTIRLSAYLEGLGKARPAGEPDAPWQALPLTREAPPPPPPPPFEFKDFAMGMGNIAGGSDDDGTYVTASTDTRVEPIRLVGVGTIGVYDAS
ncbi:hypothetical protein HLB44_02555 [Aquincola sp. S2]|uniref:Calcium-binding protein n=1 Tax=Pseudaquabacterium terrae TaxID=2732868 RepID=A0ABX2EBF8_9BURK|nr:hypothetical protein [Aquabacterium terrae]NRF65861.1 hypothetical protein [Aquabacterium terrae]